MKSNCWAGIDLLQGADFDEAADFFVGGMRAQ
jgi:hypothetical protein